MLKYSATVGLRRKLSVVKPW